MFNNILMEIKDDPDCISEYLEKIKDKFDKDNICLYFLHYNKENILNDTRFIQEFEQKYKININFINVVNLFNEHKILNEKLKAVTNEKFNENIVLAYIKEYIESIFLHSCKFITNKMI